MENDHSQRSAWSDARGVADAALPGFRSFFMAGFECSTHRIGTGRRLDLVASTRHDEFCLMDYERLAGQGIRVVREGLRWHLIERTPEVYDFSSVRPMVDAARRTGVQVMWDLCHYGWPDHLDLFKPEFIRGFCRYAQAFAKWIGERMPGPLFVAPINEISFFSWAGGQSEYMHPFGRGRGLELKVQLVRAAIEGMNAFRSVIPGVRFLQIDPLIRVIPHPNRPHDRRAAEAYSNSKYQAWDMLAGTEWPQLGGEARHLDIIGVNFYPTNQWMLRKEIVRRGHPLYQPLRELLHDVHERYHRPLFLSETGCEAEDRREWLEYVCEEVVAAQSQGVPVHGICLYPIVNHLGWDNDRDCENGLWGHADDAGRREMYQPLAEELARWRPVFERSRPPATVERGQRSELNLSL